MSYLLDADWAIHALAGRRQAVTILEQLAPQGIALSWVSVGEIYERAFHSPNPQAHLATFREFLEPFRLLGLSDPVMERFADVRAYLRRRGGGHPGFRVLLGATALVPGGYAPSPLRSLAGSNLPDRCP